MVTWWVLLEAAAGKRLSGLLEGLRCPPHCSCDPVGFAQGKRKKAMPVWMLGEAGPLPKGSEMRRGKDVTLHLTAPPTNA